MSDRRPIQQALERAYVDYFLDWFNRAYRTDFKVISESNPPEAIVRSSRATRWVEVALPFGTSLTQRISTLTQRSAKHINPLVTARFKIWLFLQPR